MESLESTYDDGDIIDVRDDELIDITAVSLPEDLAKSYLEMVDRLSEMEKLQIEIC